MRVTAHGLGSEDDFVEDVGQRLAALDAIGNPLFSFDADDSDAEEWANAEDEE